MPAPTNISIATATDISGLLPYTLNQNVHDAGSTYTVWYTYTPDYTGTLGVFGFGALADYTPQTSVFFNAGLDIYRGIFNYPWRPIQLPVTTGVQIWFRFLTNTPTFSPAVLTGLIQKFNASGAPIGSIFINDASSHVYLSTLLSGSTGAPLDYVQDFPGGEAMTQLTNGVMLVENLADTNLQLYSPSYAHIATLAISDVVTLSSDRASTFYIGINSTGIVSTVSDGGVAGPDTWDVGASVAALAPSRDNTILYNAAGATAAVIRRWDLINDLGLTDLAAGVADHTVREIFVLADDTVLVLYRKIAPDTAVCFVRHYSAAGATILDYTTQFTDSTGVDPHLAMALDDPTTFWAWFKVAGAQSRFINIQTSTGVINSTAEWTHFTSGFSDAAATATPVDYFGHSESCTFLITITGIVPPSPTESEVHIRRRLRTFPHLSEEQIWAFHKWLQIDMETGVGLSDPDDQGYNPQVMLRWSDDGGHTWSNVHQKSMGLQGQYRHRIMYRQLGRSRDRIYELSMSDPVRATVIAGYIEAEAGIS